MFNWLLAAADRLRHQARLRRWHHDLAFGRRGEDLAHRYLSKRGFRVVARNWRTRSGAAEVDLIAREGNILVFVEVKSRLTGDYGGPERAVDIDKARRLLRAAAEYIHRTAPAPVRFDVVTVIHSRPPHVEHLRDVFAAGSI